VDKKRASCGTRAGVIGFLNGFITVGKPDNQWSWGGTPDDHSSGMVPKRTFGPDKWGPKAE
jgi:hypothetical protein